MPGTSSSRDPGMATGQGIEAGKGIEPPVDSTGDTVKSGPNRPPTAGRYYTGIVVGILAVLMFFMALASAFLLRKTGPDWVPVRIPSLLWLNTLILLGSSGTIEQARKRLAGADLPGFKKWWFLTTLLGLLFLIGQLAAWRILVRQGVYLASNPASSFFYIFTGAHALHLLGGIAALVFVARRDFGLAHTTRMVAAEITSYYWHFMDALWLFLLGLLYLSK